MDKKKISRKGLSIMCLPDLFKFAEKTAFSLCDVLYRVLSFTKFFFAFLYFSNFIVLPRLANSTKILRYYKNVNLLFVTSCWVVYQFFRDG